MSKSKIAIVIAPSIELSQEVLTQVYATINDADAVAFIVPHQMGISNIDAVLATVDGVLLFSPTEFVPTERLQFQEIFIRSLGRAAVLNKTNPVFIVGGVDYYGTDEDWKEVPFFSGGNANVLPPSFGPRFFDELGAFARNAGKRAAFMHLARATQRTHPAELRSPVTHG